MDSDNRNGVEFMFLAVPKDLANSFYKILEAHQDDPTMGLRILAHVLGEDLDINYEDQSKKPQFAEMSVNKVKLRKNQ